MSEATTTEGAHRKLPDEKRLAQAGEVMIEDQDGKKVPLNTLWSGRPADQRQLIIFVRHFYCGSCKQYVEAICQSFTPQELARLNLELTLVGCGASVCIRDYKADTGCQLPVYADPSVESYKLLEMMSNLKQPETQPEYITKGIWSNVALSAWKGLTSGRPLSAGPPAQNGGEWLFQGGELKWCHRMRNTADHTDVKELRSILAA